MPQFSPQAADQSQVRHLDQLQRAINQEVDPTSLLIARDRIRSGTENLPTDIDNKVKSYLTRKLNGPLPVTGKTTAGRFEKQRLLVDLDVRRSSTGRLLQFAFETVNSPKMSPGLTSRLTSLVIQNRTADDQGRVDYAEALAVEAVIRRLTWDALECSKARPLGHGEFRDSALGQLPYFTRLLLIDRDEWVERRRLLMPKILRVIKSHALARGGLFHSTVLAWCLDCSIGSVFEGLTSPSSILDVIDVVNETYDFTPFEPLGLGRDPVEILLDVGANMSFLTGGMGSAAQYLSDRGRPPARAFIATKGLLNPGHFWSNADLIVNEVRTVAPPTSDHFSAFSAAVLLAAACVVQRTPFGVNRESVKVALECLSPYAFGARDQILATLALAVVELAVKSDNSVIELWTLAIGSSFGDCTVDQQSALLTAACRWTHIDLNEIKDSGDRQSLGLPKLPAISQTPLPRRTVDSRLNAVRTEAGYAIVLKYGSGGPIQPLKPIPVKLVAGAINLGRLLPDDAVIGKWFPASQTMVARRLRSLVDPTGLTLMSIFRTVVLPHDNFEREIEQSWVDERRSETPQNVWEGDESVRSIVTQVEQNGVPELVQLGVASGLRDDALVMLIVAMEAWGASDMYWGLLSPEAQGTFLAEALMFHMPVQTSPEPDRHSHTTQHLRYPVVAAEPEDLVRLIGEVHPRSHPYLYSLLDVGPRRLTPTARAAQFARTPGDSQACIETFKMLDIDVEHEDLCVNVPKRNVMRLSDGDWGSLEAFDLPQPIWAETVFRRVSSALSRALDQARLDVAVDICAAVRHDPIFERIWWAQSNSTMPELMEYVATIGNLEGYGRRSSITLTELSLTFPLISESAKGH